MHSDKLLILPIRHHSPASALQVRRSIEERRPKLVLIEGPADASELIPLLTDRGTVPPVALYAYRPGAEARAIFYPFCAYSPEYVAAAAGVAVGATVEFCDVPANINLDWPAKPVATEEPPDDIGPSFLTFGAALADATGNSSFEEFWEASFEQGARESDAFVELMGEFGRLAKLIVASPDERDDLRERFMAGAVRLALTNGVAAGEIILVCGAAHVQSVARYVASDAEPGQPTPGVPADIALIPYSFPRLGEQSGYGAGNRAPWYYQQVWESQNDYAKATRLALTSLARYLRSGGYLTSVAQCVDGYNLARTLATMRDKPAPGVDEVVAAAVACFSQGQPAVVQSALRAVLIGNAVGRVTHKVGRTPLQSEFYRTAEQFRIAVVDAPRELLVHMTSVAEAGQSIFLHRLAIAGIPFAREVESGLGGGGRTVVDDPLGQLARVREKWEVQWTPLTDAALVERNAEGNTLVEVTGRILREQIARAAHVDDATAILLRLVLCDLVDNLKSALVVCENLAADSSSFPALARAAYHVDGLLNYGAARQLPILELTSLAQRLFLRAVLQLHQAVGCGDDSASEVEHTLIALYELVRRGSSTAGDPADFWNAIERAVEEPSCHPILRGLSLALLDLAGRLPPGELAGRLRFWLSFASDAGDNARLISGLFALHRGTLIRNRSLIGAVTDFLCELTIDQLVPLLPVLRRTLGDLSPSERAYLVETVTAVLGLDRGRRSRESSPAEIARARAADAAVAATLAQWERRYGIA